MLRIAKRIGTFSKRCIGLVRGIKGSSRPCVTSKRTTDSPTMLTADAVLDWHQLLLLVKFDFKGHREPAVAGRPKISRRQPVEHAGARPIPELSAPASAQPSY